MVARWVKCGVDYVCDDSPSRYYPVSPLDGSFSMGDSIDLSPLQKTSAFWSGVFSFAGFILNLIPDDGSGCLQSRYGDRLRR